MKNKYIEIKNKQDCTGCRACEQICPVHAIDMIEDDEGFLIPNVDKNKCINCGLCVKTCGQIERFENKNQLKKNIFYGVKPVHAEISKNSSSGGMAYLISKKIINEKGIVFGCAYDKDLMPYQTFTFDVNELQKFRGSKYVTSDTRDTFLKVKDFLENGKEVLYIGVPCQIGGLKKFLKKEYKNLYTIDIICHGVPSQKIFKKFLENEEKKNKKKICRFEFRNKDKLDWGMGYCARVDFEDEIKYKKADFTSYYSAFLNGIIYRESCYKCRYANLDRIGDITLGDLWGIEQFDYKFYDKNGMNLLIVNTEKGKEILNKIDNEIIKKEYEEDKVTKFNGNLLYPTSRNDIRDDIYKKLDEMTFEQYEKKYLLNKNKIKFFIKNITPKKIKVFYKKYLKQVKK